MRLEEKNRITYHTIEALNEMGIGYLIVTKSPLVADDKYIEIMDKKLAHIQVSVTSTDNGISKRIEPGAALPMERINAIEKLQRLGFDVQIRLSPYIPELIDISTINAIRCDKILVEFLRVNSWIEKWISNTSLGIDLEPYNEYPSGYKHLSLDNKIQLLNAVDRNSHQVSVCEDVEEHWNYWRDNVNADKDDCCNLRI